MTERVTVEEQERALSASTARETRGKLRRVAVLYFAQGLPMGVVKDILPVWFRVHGVSLEQVGLLNLLGMPWTLKVLWAPLVDRFGERRTWICGALAVLAALSGGFMGLDPATAGALVWIALLSFTTAAATQDVAIDAHTIQILDRGEEGKANGVRVSAYRAALIFAGGGLVALAGRTSWDLAFAVVAATFAALALAATRYGDPVLPVVDGAVAAAHRAGAVSEWFGPLRAWIARPGAPLIFLFVLTYKLGDASMGPMVKPFWLDRGLTVEEVGLISTTIGVALSVVGSLLGGWLTDRWGVFRALWRLGLLQAISNLGYAGAAWADAGRAGIYAASVCESLTGGMGTAAFLSFLMRICDKQRAATEYALLSAIFSLTATVAGAASGFGAARLGYASFFAFTFVLSFPAYALLPWVRRWVDAADV